MISIHAPTRGATVHCGNKALTSHKFQSTLPREERRAKRTCLPKEPSDFNPRSHERSDDSYNPLVTGTYDFNPRSHERSDLCGCLLNRPYIRFQSTLPREERRSHYFAYDIHKYFNPRSHERSDSNIAQKICLFLYNTDNKYIIR